MHLTRSAFLVNRLRRFRGFCCDESRAEKRNKQSLIMGGRWQRWSLRVACGEHERTCRRRQGASKAWCCTRGELRRGGVLFVLYTMQSETVRLWKRRTIVGCASRIRSLLSTRLGNVGFQFGIMLVLPNCLHLQLEFQTLVDAQNAAAISATTPMKRVI